jgi:hypothetical protein
MNATLIRAAALATALSLAGCASGPPETRVTRFHLGQQLARGQIALEPRDQSQARSLEFTTYANAVSAELVRLGFGLAPGFNRSELVAVVDVARDTREGLARRSPFSIGLGGGTFGRNVGVGGGVQIPIGKRRSNEIVATALSVQIKRRSEGTVIWEGRAITEAAADAPSADPDAAIRRLASALFKDFPGESGRTVIVK